MPDDALGYLGLDVSGFQKSATSADSAMAMMQKEAAFLNKEILRLESSYRKLASSGAKSFEAKGKKNDLRDRIGIAKNELDVVNKQITAKDKLAKTEQKRLERIAALNRKNAGKSTGEVIEESGGGGLKAGAAGVLRGLGVGVGGLGIAAVVAAAVAAIVKLGRAIVNFGATTNETAERLQGSRRFADIQAASGGGENTAAGMSAELEQFAEKAKAKIIGEAAKDAEAMIASAQATGEFVEKKVENFAEDVKDGFSGPAWAGFRGIFDKVKSAVSGAAKAGAKVASAATPDVLKNIAATAEGKAAAAAERGKAIMEGASEMRYQEDKISEAVKNQTMNFDEQTAIMNEQARLLAMRIDYYSKEDTFDRAKYNSAKAAYGQLQMQLEARSLERKEIIATAEAETSAMQAKQRGMSLVAEIVKTEFEYNLKINRARREGKQDLLEQLRIQKQMKLNELAVAEHNLTPRERREERRAAQKFARDLRHVAREEYDLEERFLRARRQGNKITPGSRLARYAERRARLQRDRLHDFGANAMRVNEFVANSLTVGSAVIPNVP